MSKEHSSVENIVRESTAFETIQRRLRTQGGELGASIGKLNEARADVFGSSSMALLGRARVRTENNAIARDMVRIGEQILFGFNVQLGLRKALEASDIFALYYLKDDEEGLELSEAPFENSFLTESRFVQDFKELQKYYSHATLVQLITLNNKLLIAFQIGEKLSDLRVFRWELAASGEVSRYIDNRGERDLVFPDRFAFPWQTAARPRPPSEYP